MPVVTRARVDLLSLEGDGLRFRATDERGLFADLDTGEGAVAMSPTELLLAALGGCAGMDVIGVLRKKRQQVTGYAIELIGQRREDHPRAYTAIEIVHRVTGRGLSKDAIADAIRLSDTKYCSVHATLAPGVALTSRFEVTEEA